MCTTGALEKTRSHEVENNLNFKEGSSFIPDYLALILVSPPQNKTIDLIALG